MKVLEDTDLAPPQLLFSRKEWYRRESGRFVALLSPLWFLMSLSFATDMYQVTLEITN